VTCLRVGCCFLCNRENKRCCRALEDVVVQVAVAVVQVEGEEVLVKSVPVPVVGILTPFSSTNICTLFSSPSSKRDCMCVC
jgi:hypothetical protein